MDNKNHSGLKIKGIVPPMVTPLESRDQIDHPGLECLIEHILAGGVHGLFILGTTGEAQSLGYAVRREMIEATCKLVRDRVPVLVGVTDTSFTESVSLAAHAKVCGADAVVIAPPYYFRASQAELLNYYQSIMSEIHLPVMLYNIPSLTKVAIEIDTLRVLLEDPKVIGLKDSSGSMLYFNKALQVIGRHEDRTLLVGSEEMLGEAVLIGGHGGVNGGANLFPRLYTAMYAAACSGDVSQVRLLQDRIMNVSRMYGVGTGYPSPVKAIKHILAEMNICRDVFAEPIQGMCEHDREQLRELWRRCAEVEAGTDIPTVLN